MAANLQLFKTPTSRVCEIEGAVPLAAETKSGTSGCSYAELSIMHSWKQETYECFLGFR